MDLSLVWGSMIIHSNLYSFRAVYFLPLMLEILIQLWHSNRVLLISFGDGSRFLRINGDSYPTCISTLFENTSYLKLCGGAIGMYITHPTFLDAKWLVSDPLPMTGRTINYLLVWCELVLLKMFITYPSDFSIVVKDFKTWIHQYHKDA